MWRESENRGNVGGGESFTLEGRALSNLKYLFKRWQMNPSSPELKNEVRELAISVHPDKNPDNPLMLEISKLCNTLLDACKKPELIDYTQENFFRGELQKLESSLTTKPDNSTIENRSWDTSEEGERETIPYELKEFKITNELVGKNIFEAKLDLDHEMTKKILNQYYFNQSGYSNCPTDPGSHLLSIKIEGIDGVLIAYSEGTDAYHSDVGGWIHITNLEPKDVKPLGTIANINFDQRRHEFHGASRYTDFSEIRMDSGIVIEFGKYMETDYFAKIRKNSKN